MWKDYKRQRKTNDMHVLQNHDTFTLYKHKSKNNFRHQKCERVDFFLCFNWTTFSQSERWIKYWCWKWWKYRNEHLEKLDQLNKHKRICHLNTQSISSTFSEFKIHNKPSKLWLYYTFKNVAEKWQTFTRIC